MSSITWTATALASEKRTYRGQPWRAIEAQHQIATRRLSSDLRRQAILEQLLEDESKPALPGAAAHLHYLASTPFRYRPKRPSRLRPAGARGIWYGAGQLRTALTESAYWRAQFWKQSPASKRPEREILLTAIRGKLHTAALLDLSAPPLATERAQWLEEPPYPNTIELARAATEAHVQVIRYESLREIQCQDRSGLACYAVLSPRAFAGDGIVARSERNFAVYLHAAGVDVIATAGPERIALSLR